MPQNDLFLNNIKCAPEGEYANIYIDGASRGNPGPSGVGIIIIRFPGKVLNTFSEFIGYSTNNVAEYQALIIAMEKAKELNIKNIRVHSDSELLVNQIKGVYRVKNERLENLYMRVNNLVSFFDHFRMVLIPREENMAADGLASAAIKKAPKEGKHKSLEK